MTPPVFWQWANILRIVEKRRYSMNYIEKLKRDALDKTIKCKRKEEWEIFKKR